jgi:hypothetical protein
VAFRVCWGGSAAVPDGSIGDLTRVRQAGFAGTGRHLSASIAGLWSSTSATKIEAYR